MANELFHTPRLDADGYYDGLVAYMKDPATGEPMWPARSVQADAPCADPQTADAFYKWDGEKFVAEKKPTTCAECVALGPVSHQSQTARCNELRQRYQALVEADSEHFKIIRGDNLEWIVEAIPEKTEEEKYEEACEAVRSKRDALISGTDYLMTSDYPIDEETRAAVSAYRQALRDVPQQDGFPYAIVWPEKPVITASN